MKQVIDNAEAQALFTAIGAGSGKDFNLADARYGRIIILCDADVDGSHIRCLLLTLIYHYMRPLLEAGRVFAAQPPLYTVKVGDKIHHAFSDADHDRITDELTKGNRQRREPPAGHASRASARWTSQELAESRASTPAPGSCAASPWTTPKRPNRRPRCSRSLMGNDVASRKDYLVKNSALFDRAALDI